MSIARGTSNQVKGEESSTGWQPEEFLKRENVLFEGGELESALRNQFLFQDVKMTSKSELKITKDFHIKLRGR